MGQEQDKNCIVYRDISGFPGGSVVKNLSANARRQGFNPWVGKIHWRRKWEPKPVFLPGKIPWTEEPGWLQPMELQSQI